MTHSEAVLERSPADSPRRAHANVTELAAWRRESDVLETITIVFGGVNYGTIPIRTPYAGGKPIRLYVIPSSGTASCEPGAMHGGLDCLITDDPALGADLEHLR